MIISRKRLEEEKNRAVWEEQERRMTRDRFESIEKHMCELENQMFDLRMKYDDAFRARNTPMCGSTKNP